MSTSSDSSSESDVPESEASSNGDGESPRTSVYVADGLFLAGIVAVPLFIGAGAWGDAVFTALVALFGAAHSVTSGQPWPGAALLRYHRRR